MRRSVITVGTVAILAAVYTGAFPAIAAAQSVGVGTRLAFVKGDDSPVLEGTDESKARFAGAYVRLRTGRVGFEAALDYHKTTDAVDTTITSYPFFGSLMYHMGQGPSGPYLLAGVGYFSQRLRVKADDGSTPSTVAHSVGYHAGAGLELAIGRRASVYADYRYTFADRPTFDDLAGFLSSFAPGSSAGDNRGLDVRGSMWTTGLTIYF
jgi:hypothetical protein